MTSAIAVLEQWPRPDFSPGLPGVLESLEHAARIERQLGNWEARNDPWGLPYAWCWWSEIAEALEPIASTVSALMGWEYDPEMPGFFWRRGRYIPPAQAFDLVKTALVEVEG
jgi:hypothetical protein